MAKETPTKLNTTPSPKPPKLSRLSKEQKIHKRPLLHPAIAPPRSGASTQKVIYVSATSPFISTVKRLRKLLSHIESRSAGPISFGRSNERTILRQIEEGVKNKAGGRGEEVILKATGKAIERLLGLAVWAQGQEDLAVVVKTHSVGAIDDVVARDGDAEQVEDETRVRRTSCLQVGVSLR